MRKIEVVDPSRSAPQQGYRAPACRLAGAGRSRAASPPGTSIWMNAVELEAGSALRWAVSHGDEAIFVAEGELEVDGLRCPAGGAVVIEAGARPSVAARTASRILHMGAQDPEDSGVGGAAVHVLGPRGVFEALEPGRETHFFADATCPTCRVWLLRTARSFAYESPVHSHSQDELIHVLRGEIALGSLRVGPGASLFIAAHQPYRFRAGREGFAFLNYRRAASQMTMRATGEKIVENGAATGMTPVVDPGA